MMARQPVILTGMTHQLQFSTASVYFATLCESAAGACEMLNVFDHAYYYTLKNEGRRRVVDALNKKIKAHGNRELWDKLTLCSINKESIEYARLNWPKYYGPATHEGLPYSWERLYYQFSPRPAYFDLAIWQQVGDQKVLQGMALGKPSNGKTHLSINWVERSPEPTYFRGGILLPVLACAEEYAKLLGCHRVVIKDTVDPGGYRLYGYAPYTIPKVGVFPAKEVDHG
jgi:hypothetical protein